MSLDTFSLARVVMRRRRRLLSNIAGHILSRASRHNSHPHLEQSSQNTPMFTYAEIIKARIAREEEPRDAMSLSI